MIGALIFIGGGLGSLARWGVGVWALERFGTSFPVGTLIVNLAGCFALGIVAHIAHAGSWSPDMRGAIAIGVLGGFTTYSSFNQETLSMMAGGAPAAAVANVAVTLGGGLLAGWIGIVVARQLVA
jgi:fluoride exporter